MFTVKFKCSVTESVLYFYDWMVETLIYDIKLDNGNTLFLIHPKSKINGNWIWLNSSLFK